MSGRWPSPRRAEKVVGERGFEPPAPASRRRISSPHQRASHAPWREQNVIRTRVLRSFSASKVQSEPRPLSICASRHTQVCHSRSSLALQALRMATHGSVLSADSLQTKGASVTIQPGTLSHQGYPRQKPGSRSTRRSPAWISIHPEHRSSSFRRRCHVQEIGPARASRPLYLRRVQTSSTGRSCS